jgi:cellulose synthase/poly-beta-1,6-N-acetylglucosamine synthase-like glycosyltransferase
VCDLTAAVAIFWLAAGLLFFTYAGYPLVLALLCLVRRKPPTPEHGEWPRLSVLVVAFNEEGQIERKLRNVLSCRYPPDRLEVIVCSDGSTDRTNEIVRGFGDPRVKLAATKENRGVNEAFAHGAKQAAGDLFLMTDSGGLFEPEALQIAVRHFADPGVGSVNGLFDHANPEGKPVASGYRSYWAVETTVRLLESRLGFGCVIVGAFEVIRRELYRPIDSSMGNDMIVPMELYAKGFRVVYEPRAVVRAPQEKGTGQEFKRRVRVAIRGWSTLPLLLRAVPFWKTPGNWLVLISHKYLRWLSGPLMLAMLAANACLLDRVVYRWVFVLQVVFYGLALAGWVISLLAPRIPRLLVLPYYFCLLHMAGMVGLSRALVGHQVRTWKPEA